LPGLCVPPHRLVTCPGRLPAPDAVTLPKYLLFTERVVIITLRHHR
jgi:hypothetical protein